MDALRAPKWGGMPFLSVVAAILAIICVLTPAVVLVTGKAVDADLQVVSGDCGARFTNVAVLIGGALALLIFAQWAWADPRAPVTLPTAGPTTMSAAPTPLGRPSPSARAYPGNELSVADRQIFSDDVVQIQERLLELGYDLGEDGADGHFGPLTEVAIADLQSRSSPAANGRVGYQTWQLLLTSDRRLLRECCAVPGFDSVQRQAPRGPGSKIGVG